MTFLKLGMSLRKLFRLGGNTFNNEDFKNSNGLSGGDQCPSHPDTPFFKMGLLDLTEIIRLAENCSLLWFLMCLTIGMKHFEVNLRSYSLFSPHRPLSWICKTRQFYFKFELHLLTRQLPVAIFIIITLLRIGFDQIDVDFFQLLYLIRIPLQCFCDGILFTFFCCKYLSCV